MRSIAAVVMVLSVFLAACPGGKPAPATTPAPTSSSSDHEPTETEKAVQADIEAEEKAKADAEAEAGGPKLDGDCYEGCILSQPEPTSDEADAVCTTDCTI